MIRACSPMSNPGSKGFDISEVKLYQVRVYANDERLFLSKLKTYNGLDHEGGKQRHWRKHFNRIVRFCRSLFGLGVVPLTKSDYVDLLGHVVVLARTEDKKDKNGREFR